MDVIRQDDRRRAEQTPDDGQFACQICRRRAFQNQVGSPAGEHDAASGGRERQNRIPSGSQRRHVPFLSQVGREPGEKENERRVPTKLSDTCSPYLAVAKQLAYLSPVQGSRRGGGSCCICAFAISIEGAPNQREGDSDRSDKKEQP